MVCLSLKLTYNRGKSISKRIFMKQARSPLRYPGGKTRAIKQILPRIPHQFTEYREPFIGVSILRNT